MATARQFTITDEMVVEQGGGAAYATLDVPGDYEAVLVSAEDYDKTSSGGGTGWVFTFLIEGLRFKFWVPFSDAARWKYIQAHEAFEPDFLDQRDEDGLAPVFDPDSHIGDSVAAFVDYENDDEGERDENGRKIIVRIYPLVEEASEVPML